MGRTPPPYTPEYKRQIVELYRAGRTIPELVREFEPTDKSIREWIAQADREEGLRTDGLTTLERDELQRLRRENRQLKVEREILAKATAQVQRGRPRRSHPSLLLREREPGALSRRHHVPSAGCLLQRVLRVAHPRPLGPRSRRRVLARPDPGDP